MAAEYESRFGRQRCAVKGCAEQPLSCVRTTLQHRCVRPCRLAAELEDDTAAPMASSQSSQTTSMLPSQPGGACELQQQLRNMEGQVQRVLQELRRKEDTLARERAVAIRLQVRWVHFAVQVLQHAVPYRKLWPCLSA